MSLRRRARRHLLHREPGWQLLAFMVWSRRNARRAVRSAQMRARPRGLVEPYLGDLSGVQLDFPQVDAPLVSVVIPVFNQWALTRDCLASLVLHAPLDRIEVIVADDASTDETPSQLDGIANLVVVRNPSNLGFTRTANRGAAAARGEFVLFLNNDTRVMPGWLEGLLAAMRDEAIGAVGSRLLFPSGLLQEAGGLIWSDASGWNIGRDRLPHHTQYSFRRDVDYCSGASLMVRTALWRELGGFDERFAPAYYEDTDLCFALRARGHRVVCAPASSVIHFEGGTHGTESRRAAAGAHTKQNQYRNQGVFAEKWATELQRRLPPPSRDLLLSELRGSLRAPGPRVLVCDALIPTPDRDSGSQRMDWILRLLTGLASHVTLYPMYGADAGAYSTALEDAGVEVINDPTTTFRRFARRRAGFYDLVILSRMDTGGRLGVIQRRFPKAKVVFDTVDLHFLREQREAATTGGATRSESNRSWRTERRLIAACDVTAAVTEVEADMIRETLPDTRVVVLPNVHDVGKREAPGFAARHGLLFIGSFRHAPNADAVRFFIDEVLPRVRERIDAELVVVGDAPPPDLRARAGGAVRFAGYVPEVVPLFDSARVFVSPLRFGAGMKGKNGQAMGLGLPMVTTTIGAEGMDLVDGEHAMIRDDAAGFAEAVVRLYGDEVLWGRLAVNAQNAVAARWSPAAMRDRLRCLLDTTR